MLQDNRSWMIRIKDVERDYQTLRTILVAHIHQWQKLSQEYPGLKRQDIDSCKARLESSMLVRLFAEFESGLRSYWKFHQRHTTRKTVPKTEDLLNSLGARQRINTELIANVHRVRSYRNGIIHANNEPLVPVALSQSRSWLCTFFSSLPEYWDDGN